jgi:glucose-1-phosphate thymidylyltransferase|uniref:Glucose-1-phosphate thymidylyltransferase n=1 Tax=candidate division WOR-3 bacterium TaxID=2052148 RepID=A0A7C4TE23_UNCW3
MKGLILSGGFGTRLRPLTYTSAKQLIPVANKPIIFYGIESLVNAGIKEIGIVVGETAEEVKKTVGDGSKWNIKIEYIHQPLPLGLAHAIKVSRNFLEEESFIMYLGDNILKEGVNDFVKKFINDRPDALILLTEVDNPQEFGVAVVDSNGMVKKLIEKPKEPPSNLALVGVYLFNKNIFTAVENIKPSWRNEFEITDAIQWLLDNNFNVLSHRVKGWWKDTGKPEDIIEANLLVLEDIESSNEGIIVDTATSGRIRTGSGTRIERSVIRGPVVIGSNVQIRNAFIGPFTSIGDNVLIENSEIECSVIMEGARIINLKKRIDRSIIGKNVTISQTNTSPRSHRFYLGDQSFVEIVE